MEGYLAINRDMMGFFSGNIIWETSNKEQHGKLLSYSIPWTSKHFPRRWIEGIGTWAQVQRPSQEACVEV